MDEFSAFSDLEKRMMERALALAEQAAAAGEVPIGSVVFNNSGEVLGEGQNASIATNDISAHAEILALRAAGAHTANYRLTDLHLAVTLEPCPMCASAIFQARLATLTFAAADPKGGACGSVIDLSTIPAFNHHTKVRGGLLANRASEQLQNFFRARRA